jgi:hypothetical protein
MASTVTTTLWRLIGLTISGQCPGERIPQRETCMRWVSEPELSSLQLLSCRLSVGAGMQWLFVSLLWELYVVSELKRPFYHLLSVPSNLLPRSLLSSIRFPFHASVLFPSSFYFCLSLSCDHFTQYKSWPRSSGSVIFIVHCAFGLRWPS